jgi:hypothetical protein
MIEVTYILHNLDREGNRIEMQNYIRKQMAESEQEVIDSWAYLGKNNVEILSTRDLTEGEVELKKATAKRIAQDYRQGVYNGD